MVNGAVGIKLVVHALAVEEVVGNELIQGVARILEGLCILAIVAGAGSFGIDEASVVVEVFPGGNVAVPANAIHPLGFLSILAVVCQNAVGHEESGEAEATCLRHVAVVTLGT